MRRGLWALAAAAAAASLAGTASAARPLETAVFPEQEGPAPVTFQRIALTGATKVRLILNWRKTAPARRPAGFDPDDPADPAYRWAAFDEQVRRAADAGLAPIVSIFVAPAWASGSSGIVRPDPRELARFARAAALRYGGSFQGLPRVRYWQVWNEPNLEIFLSPQYVGRKPFSPRLYRRMTNQFYDAVKGVHPDNLVVAGGTAPFHDSTPVVFKVNPNWGPLTFMRELLCLSRSLKKNLRREDRLRRLGAPPAAATISACVRPVWPRR